MDWLQSAAESGLAEAQYELGRILIQGDQLRGIQKNSKKTRQWWEKAADNGHGRAMEELAWRYTQAADGFPRDPARAIALLEKIADGYRQGRYGLPENQQMASSRQKQADEINALEKRAAKGDPEALATIGVLTWLAGGKGQVKLARKITTIGKDPSSDIVVKGMLIDPTTATIRLESDGYYLDYISGLTKPKVNENTVKESTILNNLDIIEIGSAKLQFSDETP